jgi:hypothetical protein
MLTEFSYRQMIFVCNKDPFWIEPSLNSKYIYIYICVCVWRRLNKYKTTYSLDFRRIKFFLCSYSPHWAFIHFPVGSQLEHRAPFGVSVITHTIRHTVGLLWTSDQPVAEAWATHKHKRQASIPSAGFEPVIPATKRPQTYALDRAATGIGRINEYF